MAQIFRDLIIMREMKHILLGQNLKNVGCASVFGNHSLITRNYLTLLSSFSRDDNVNFK